MMAVLAAAMAAGCASTGTRTLEPGTIIDARSGRTVSFEGMMDSLENVPMVFVGESHNHPEHHELQRRILVALAQRRPHLQLGMEMFQRPMQPVLDEWSGGDHDEDWFLRNADWFGQWGFDWSLYRGIILSARDHDVRLVALNTEREVTRAISKSGIEGMPGWLRARLPSEMDFAQQRHRDAIRAVFDSHPGVKLTDERFERFYQSQCTWDETMAQSTAIALDADPRDDATILVIAGSMHVKDFDAIPDRVRRRNGKPYLTVLPVENRGDDSRVVKVGRDRPADFVILTAPGPSMAKPRLGVGLRGGDNLVSSAPEGFPAHNAGLREGDLLLSIDGRAIRDMVDLRLALDGVTDGRKLELVWSREGAETKATALMVPPPPPSGP
jgi:uncharacterized iron-regulated protein